MAQHRHHDPRDRARRLARSMWDVAWSPVRDRLDALSAGAPGPHVPGRRDARLARRLSRDAERARQARLQAKRRHDEALARRERLLRRSRRALPAGLAVAAGSSAASVLLYAPDGAPLLWALAAAGGARAAVAARRLRRPPPVPPAPGLDVGPPPPPHPRSAAAPAVRRLDQAHVALRSLLSLVAPSGRGAAEEAWHAAAEADAALRWQAARLAAAEPYRGVDPVLLARLEAGVAAQEGLVQAVADLVAASADPCGDARVQDLTDRLHGLADGLRAVR